MTDAPGPPRREQLRRLRGEAFARELGVVVPGTDVRDLDRRLGLLACSRVAVGIAAVVVGVAGLATRVTDQVGGLAIALPLVALVVVLALLADQTARERGPHDSGPGLAGGAELLGPLLRYGAPLLLALLALAAAASQDARAWWLPGGYVAFLLVAQAMGDHLARLPLPEPGSPSRSWRIAWRATVLATMQGLAGAVVTVGAMCIASPYVFGTVVSSFVAPVLGAVIGTLVGRPRRLVARSVRRVLVS